MDIKNLSDFTNKLKTLGSQLGKGTDEAKSFEKGFVSLQVAALKLIDKLGKDAPAAIDKLNKKFDDAHKKSGNLNVALALTSDALGEMSAELNKAATFTDKLKSSWGLLSGSLATAGAILSSPISGLELLGKTFKEVDKLTLNYQNSIFLTGQEIKARSSDFKNGAFAISFFKDSVDQLTKSSKLGKLEATKLLSDAFKGTSGLLDGTARKATVDMAAAVAELGLTSEEAAKKMQELQEVGNKFTQFRGKGITSGVNQAMAMSLFSVGKISAAELGKIGFLGKEMSPAKVFGGKGYEGEDARKEAAQIQERDATVENARLSNSLNMAMSETHKRFLETEKDLANFSKGLVEAHNELVSAGMIGAKGGLGGSAVGFAGNIVSGSISTASHLKTLGMLGKAGSKGISAASEASSAAGLGSKAASGIGSLAFSGLGASAIGVGAIAAAAGTLAYLVYKTNDYEKEAIATEQRILDYKKEHSDQMKKISDKKTNPNASNLSTKDILEGPEISAKKMKEYMEGAKDSVFDLNQVMAKFVQDNTANVEQAKGFEESWKSINELATEFHMDVAKSKESLREQNVYIERQKQSYQNMLDILEVGLKKDSEELEAIKKTGDQEKLNSKQREIDLKISAKKGIINSQSLDIIKQEKNELEGLTKEVDLQIKLQDQNVRLAESEKNLHTAERIGVGQDIKDQIRLGAESMKSSAALFKRAKELRQLADDQTKSEGARKQAAYQANEAEIKGRQEKTKALNEMKSLREGYLEAFGEATFGAGEFAEFMPTQKSGVQAFAPTPGLGVQFGSSAQAQQAAFKGDLLKFTAEGGVSGNKEGYDVKGYMGTINDEYNKLSTKAMSDEGLNVNVTNLPPTPKVGDIGVLAESVNRNQGGLIPGIGNTDTVPAMLTPGEYVVTKDKAPFVQSLLEGGTKSFSNGGLVGDYASNQSYVSASIGDFTDFRQSNKVNLGGTITFVINGRDGMELSRKTVPAEYLKSGNSEIFFGTGTNL